MFQNLYQLENVGIAMHTNSRPPDAAPVILSFNWNAHRSRSITYPLLTDSVLLLKPHGTLCFWPLSLWTWTFVHGLWCDHRTLFHVLAKLSNQWLAELLRLQYLIYLDHVSRVALRSGIIFTNFEFGQPVSSWLMLIFNSP